jgi:hypothetical protein
MLRDEEMSIPPHTNLFTEVDRTSDPDFFVRFMDEAQKPVAIQTSKQIMPERTRVAPGEAISFTAFVIAGSKN